MAPRRLCSIFLKNRLNLTRFPDAAPGEPWAYGSLVRAFRQFIMEDAEIVALNELQRDPSHLKRGMYPGPIVRFHWPLKIAKSVPASFDHLAV